MTFKQGNSGFEDQGYYSVTWNDSDQNPCTWVGVTCRSNNTVEELDFSGWGFFIEKLEQLTALSDLRHLDLSSNLGISSEAMDSIGNLTELIRLDLSRTNVYELLSPRVFACKKLRFLNLEQAGLQAKLSKIISRNIDDLVHLQFLNLAGNLLNGPFPTEELGGLSSLVSLDLSRNSFSGSIPSLPNFTSLVGLKLDDNNFIGFEESWFLGTNRPKYLSVSDNKLEGKIPSRIANFGELSFLNMSSNSLSYEIPSGFSAAMNNTRFLLDLSRNQLTGEIPSDMLHPETELLCNHRAIFVNVSNNLLTGNIPVGSTPVCFSDLHLANNNLSGPIPSNLFTNGYVANLSPGNNKLSGDIVDVLSDLMFSLVEARLENNRFTGDLSRIYDLSEYFRGAFLEVLDLSNNLLQWTVSEAQPDPIQATLKALIVERGSPLNEFRVGGNNFSGTSLPTACFVPTNESYFTAAFTVLYFSNSQLEGEIIGAAFDQTCLPSIQFLNLSNNHANGSLPESIVADRPLSPNFVVVV